ncbi:MAG TPA: hypothetical protein ENL03_02725 [Phycisphaerae bacterium]|nr:hypothetical protein [Phycisphaerae bacterium]
MPRNDPLRVNRLRQALKSAERFTGGDFPSSRASMLLLMGRCYREIGEHDKAVGVLTIASKDSKVTQDMKFQIAFEIARNSIARGRMLGEKAKVLHAGGLASEAKSKLAEADQHFSRVDKTELPAVQQQGKLRYANGDRFDLVYAVLMKLHLYENWARAFEEDEPDKASAIALQAQKATVDAFKDLQSDTRMFNYLAKVLALKFADEKDLTKLNSMIIYSMSVQVYNKAIRANKSGDDVQAKELLARAEELLDAISGREDDLSKSISHLVLWQHANVKYYQKENLRSAELFTQVAKEYPQSQNAFTAAKNACIIYASIAKKLGESLKPDIRQDFIDALVTLLETNEDWTKQASTWWFDLGWQRQAMAETKPDAEARELLTEAMAAYKNVPEKPLGPYLQSQNQSVMIRVQMFELAAAGDQKNLAGDLAKDLANYSVLLQKKSVSGELEPEQNAMLREWGAVADFHNARIRYDVLKEAAALQELEKLPEKWKGTKILLGAAQYRIGKLIDEGRNSEATKELDSFEEDYGAAKATDLKIRILNAMRKQIEKLKRADANAERDKELAKKRAIVYKYSTDLFKQLQVRNAPKAQLYIAEQSVAFALYETGKAADALKIYEELAAYDALGRKKKADDITTEFTAILKNIKDAKGDETKAKSRAEDLLARVSKDVDPASLPACLQVLEKLLALNTAEGDEVEQISDQLTDDTVLAAEAYSKRLRVRLKIDVTNVLGVARCHGHDSLKNYDQALVAYNKLTRGIDKYARSKLYWETWQEYFELQFKAFGGKKDIMTKMAMQIRSLRSADETGSMGGLKREFLKQEQKAEKLAE